AERGHSSLVFRGDDGLDELTTTATSRIWVVRAKLLHRTLLAALGVALCCEMRLYSSAGPAVELT
ncbi:hypothetical protein ABZT43_38110, partial [Streptomyces sp. NPDC005349]|uniref:hypothetical protein n=1 Tax=Streptomyces sp. NPDC005349 TaxID=3157037 RepID=UPI0033B27B07